MPGSLIPVTRALYCCAEAYVADAVLDSGEAGEEGGFSALISSLADETALSERNGVQCEFVRLGREARVAFSEFTSVPKNRRFGGAV
jgi:hypothetical protein